MTGTGRFAKWRLVGDPPEHPLRRFDVHPLDHLVAEPLGTAVERLDQGFRPFDFGRARREGPVARIDLVGVDQALAIEAEPPPLLGFPQEALRIVEAVEHAIERRNASSARSKDDHLQRVGDRFARGIQRQAEVGAQIVGAGDQRRR